MLENKLPAVDLASAPAGVRFLSDHACIVQSIKGYY